MDATDLARLRALCDAATPGPWRVRGQGVVVGDEPDYLIVEGTGSREGDVPLVAGARNALPALLDELESLRDRLADADALLEAAQREIEGLYEIQGRDSAAMVEMRWKLKVAIEALDLITLGEATVYGRYPLRPFVVARDALAKIRGGESE